MNELDRKLCRRTTYVDDSGNSRDFMLFSGLDFDNRFLPEARAYWVHFREELAGEGILAAHVPLHAVDLIGGRGRHIHSYGEHGLSRTRHRQYLRDVVRRGLQVVADMPGIRIRIAYRNALLGKRDRPELYLAMLTDMNRDLAERSEMARIIIDGNGTDPSFRRAHRRLPAANRSINGDPIFLPAKRCDLLQAADLVAYAAFQSLAAAPNRSFMWDWLKQTFPQMHGPLAL
ncbi:DUF3800 domain-containing protein [Nonomuraea purpurea]|uniref:DUF3800 domain-containing protein n=1 Tax=Nonomuraea purpurea TaxID=1849276 RepID=A0ABV8G645_9ACTN